MAAKKVMKKVSEKKTGETYKSKAEMLKHEKSESLKDRMKEYGNKAVKKNVKKATAVKKGKK